MSNLTIIAHPVNEDKLESLKAFLKALKIKYEVSVSKMDAEGDSKEEIIEKLKLGFEDLKLYKEGKLETRNAKDLINEL